MEREDKLGTCRVCEDELWIRKKAEHILGDLYVYRTDGDEITRNIVMEVGAMANWRQVALEGKECVQVDHTPPLNNRSVIKAQNLSSTN